MKNWNVIILAIYVLNAKIKLIKNTVDIKQDLVIKIGIGEEMIFWTLWIALAVCTVIDALFLITCVAITMFGE